MSCFVFFSAHFALFRFNIFIILIKMPWSCPGASFGSGTKGKELKGAGYVFSYVIP